MRVAHDVWKLGTAKNDNGVLLLVAVNDREMRIEVGQGLEGVLTDALCSQITRNEMTPNFRQGDYDAGILLAIHAIVQAIGGEYVAEANSDSGSDWGIGDRILAGLFIFTLLGMFTVAGLRTKGKGSWVLYAFLMPFYALFPHAAIGYTAGLILLERTSLVILFFDPSLKRKAGRMMDRAVVEAAEAAGHQAQVGHREAAVGAAVVAEVSPEAVEVLAVVDQAEAGKYCYHRLSIKNLLNPSIL